MQQSDSTNIDFDPLLIPEAIVEDMGVVTVPSGTLLLIDAGLLNLWSHNRVPLLEAGTLSDPPLEELINSATGNAFRTANGSASHLSGENGMARCNITGCHRQWQ